MSGNDKKQQGVSLVELILAIAIALIILAGILTVTLRISTSGASSVQSTRLNQQVRQTMDFVSRELQRSGHVDWYDVWDADDDDTDDQVSTLVDVNTDGNTDMLDFYQLVLPVLDRFGEVTLWRFPTPGVATGTPTACSANCDCVLYSYDLNEDGMQGVGGSGTPVAGQNTDGFELFGFRWNDGAIEQRIYGTHDCTSAGWTDITDDNVNITEFSLSMGYSTATGTGNDSTVYQLTYEAGSEEWEWDNLYRQGIGTGVSECLPDPGTTTDTYDDGDVLCLLRRNIDVAIEARLADDAAVSARVRNSVKLKNDALDSSP